MKQNTKHVILHICDFVAMRCFVYRLILRHAPVNALKISGLCHLHSSVLIRRATKTKQKPTIFARNSECSRYPCRRIGETKNGEKSMHILELADLCERVQYEPIYLYLCTVQKKNVEVNSLRSV